MPFCYILTESELKAASIPWCDALASCEVSRYERCEGYNDKEFDDFIAFWRGFVGKTDRATKCLQFGKIVTSMAKPGPYNINYITYVGNAYTFHGYTLNIHLRTQGPIGKSSSCNRTLN
jgi:hypothetical protein